MVKRQRQRPALLLSVAGVDRPAIVEDYALSEPEMRRLLEIEAAAEPDLERRHAMRAKYHALPEVLTGLALTPLIAYSGAR